ncbi:Dopey, N-terminal-domain-containing protein [Hysterangium stoloniferum]|nr:Dopey, N-terminal-domain-containing protein [Hysterangium stoloniferum]
MYPSDANASPPKLNRDVATANAQMRTSISTVGLRSGERARLTTALHGDPKFKKYTAQVEKCLQTFDNVHEWADFIAFLTKLLKAFQSNMQFKEIPRKLIVAKRLSQCLNPALPTGVHQRALDVYTHILAVLGTEGLKRDLHLWSAGLFPFFEYAATSVKPTLLNLFDTYYLSLQEALRPVMKAFILALLPGLEEETGEFFDKVLSLLDRLSGTVSPAFFFQNVWLIMIITPTARQTSLNFLSRRLPKLNSDDEDFTPIIGRDVGLMVRAFSAVLEDDNLLVRRSALDLLEQSIPVNSSALTHAPLSDQRILMRAASNVVLRRDLSLNRRLFGWLLGPGPEESQVLFFRKNALDLLRETLREDMFSSLQPDSRPFKIFITLLDKWELGGPLVEVLLYDALRALKRGVLEDGESGADLLMTANALYDAVEPLLVWKQLFAAVHTELLDDGRARIFDAMSMVKFILGRLRAQEDEVQDVHLPIFFTGLVELLKNIIAKDIERIHTDRVSETLEVLSEVSRHISNTGLTRPLYKPDDDLGDSALPKRPYARACGFYGVIIGKDNSVEEEDTMTRSDVPFVTALEDLVTLSISCADVLAKNSEGRQQATASFITILSLMCDLVSRRGEYTVNVAWEPVQWLKAVLRTLESHSSFMVTDRVISTILALGVSSNLQPQLIFDDRLIMSKMMTAVLRFLRVSYAPYHVRAVQLVWMLDNVTAHNHVESLIAQSLNPSRSGRLHEAYEAFGVLWRLTDDALFPGFRFKIPMLLVLETLKNSDSDLRRIGETWMRCSLKSYTRVLEPLLFDLLDPAIRRKPFTKTYNNFQISGFVYELRFDEHRMNHLLEILISVIKFGGQGFSRVARNTPFKKSNHPGFVARVDGAKLVVTDASYLDVLLEILLRYLRSEPPEVLAPSMSHANLQIQSNVIDMIQTIVARGELDVPRLKLVEAAIIEKLYSSVHLDKVDLQNKLLHVLHSLVSALSASSGSHHARTSNNKIVDATDMPEKELVNMEDSDRVSGHSFIQINPLLLPTLVDGITRTAGRPSLQHWLDFVLMSVPQFPRLLSYTVPPLSDCVCRQLRHSIADVKSILGHNSMKLGSFMSGTTDAEFIMLLNALERLVLLSLTKGYDLNGLDKEDDSGLDRPTQDATVGSGLMGIVSNVFSSEVTGNNNEEFLSARSPGYHALHDAVRVLYALWSLTEKGATKPGSPESETLSLILNRCRTRGRKVLERLFRTQSSEVVESIVECWHKGDLENSDHVVAFDIVDALTSSSQTIVHMLCESISFRIMSSDKTKRPAVNPNLSDAVIFGFLEEYLSRLEGPLAVQVWGRCMAIAKEITSNTHGYKMQIFPMLRCITMLADKVTNTTAIEDRRTRKELQDVYIKLVDNSILIAGRSLDQGTWLRRPVRDAVPANSGTSTPLPPVQAEQADEKAELSASPSISSIAVDLPDQVNSFLVSRVLPNLRRFLFDNDKVASVCTNVVYYIIAPAMKSKATRALDIEDGILETLRELSRIPPGVKAWKTPVADAFNDTRFFNASPEVSQKWRPIIRAFLDSDRQVLQEIIGKVASGGSSNIFVNKEYETLLRSLNLRRLSYAIFTAEKNHFLAQLPSIQEKLVDILRNPNLPLMESEVYLCLRVLLCRLSPHNLSSFWPVILTELLRIFEQVTMDPPADGSDDLHVILSASKFLDLVLTLQTEEFQIHQWMFITDTVDAVYRPDSWVPEALLDQLAEIISDLPQSKTRDSKPATVDVSPSVQGRLNSALFYQEHSTVPMRRPLLTHVQQIESIRDLIPFFSHVSIASYEGVYHCAGNIDWTAIEEGILAEMFEGR